MYQRLLKFDIEDNFITKIGRKGKGPSEYHEIMDLKINDNLIIVKVLLK